MTNYNDGEWHNWSGGDRPVHQDSILNIVWRHSSDRETVIEGVSGGDVDFSGVTVNKVSAFRVIKEHKEPREWWVVARDGYAYNDEESAERYNFLVCNGTSQIIHVREVLE